MGPIDNLIFNRPFIEGLIARFMKDDLKAESAFAAARAEQEKIIQTQPNYGPALCEQLAIATRRPGDLSYGQLKLLPLWDPLRGDPRFEQIVASLAPNETK